MHKFIFLYAASLFLTGCAAPSAKVIRGPDGNSLHAITCTSDSTKCLAIASDTCAQTAGSYQVIASHSNAGGAAADLLPGPITWYRMTIACGPSDGKMPTFTFRGPQPVMPDFGSTDRGATRTTTCINLGNNLINCTTH